jgi:hypothetical protein
MELRLILVFMILPWVALFESVGRAEGSANLHTWSIVRVERPLSDYLVAAQLQHRYRFDQEKLFEEQVNLFTGRDTAHGVWTTIFTLGTLNGYERMNELRAALQWLKDFAVSDIWTFNLRLRQELRKFAEIDELAPRFRVRYQISRRLDQNRSLSLNQELNFYQTDYIGEASGFASLRTILGYQFAAGDNEASVSYLMDYREDKQPIETRHVLLLAYTFL